MIKIGQIYLPKNQSVYPNPGKRRYWGCVTNVEEINNSFLVEADFGIKKGEPENIFIDVLTRSEYEKYVTVKTKECVHCHTIKPCDDFYNSSSTPDGKQSWCKECTKEYEKTRKPRRKTCSKCGKTKPSNEFYKASDRKDGLQSRCKDCDKEHGKLHRKATPSNPDGYILPEILLKDATESQLIEKLRSIGNYRIVKIQTVEIEL